MTIKDKNINLEYVGLLILALFPIYPYFLVSISIILYIILTILDYYKRTPRIVDFRDKLYIIKSFGFYFYLIVIQFFKTDLVLNIKEFQSSIVILIIPLIAILFSRLSITSKEKLNVLLTFVFSSFLLGLVILIFGYIEYLKTEINFLHIVRNSTEKIQFLDIHPVYVSLYFAFSIIYLALSKPSINKSAKLFLIAFFTFLILLLAARIIIISLLIIAIIEIFKNSRKSIYIKSLSLVCLFSILIIGLITIPVLTKGFKEISFISEIQMPYKKFPTSSQIRLGIYECSLNLVKDNWLFGKKPYEFSAELNECYDKFGNYQKINYNTHNYYLNLLCIGGIISLILFIYSIYFQYKKAIYKKDLLNTYFVFLIFFCSMTENILSRSYGSIFFVFFVLIFSVKKPN